LTGQTTVSQNLALEIMEYLEIIYGVLGWCIKPEMGARDSWHSLKIIRADEKNTGII
jgi:hypothetical protein